MGLVHLPTGSKETGGYSGVVDGEALIPDSNLTYSLEYDPFKDTTRKQKTVRLKVIRGSNKKSIFKPVYSRYLSLVFVQSLPPMLFDCFFFFSHSGGA